MVSEDIFLRKMVLKEIRWSLLARCQRECRAQATVPKLRIFRQNKERTITKRDASLVL